MSDLDYQISVMQAHRDGKEIEACSTPNAYEKTGLKWIRASDPQWNWEKRSYRAKPGPMMVLVFEYAGTVTQFSGPMEFREILNSESLNHKVRRFIEVLDEE